jgi:hypothetical protein
MKITCKKKRRRRRWREREIEGRALGANEFFLPEHSSRKHRSMGETELFEVPSFASPLHHIPK